MLPIIKGYTLIAKEARRLTRKLNNLSSLESQVFLFSKYQGVGPGLNAGFFADSLDKEIPFHVFNKKMWHWFKKAMYNDTGRDNVQGLKVSNNLAYTTNGHVLNIMPTDCPDIELTGLNTGLIKSIAAKSIEVHTTSKGMLALVIDREWWFLNKGVKHVDVEHVAKEAPYTDYIDLDLSAKSLVKVLKKFKSAWRKEKNMDSIKRVTFSDNGHLLSLNVPKGIKIPFENHSAQTVDPADELNVTLNLDYLLAIIGKSDTVQIKMNNTFGPVFIKLDLDRKSVIMPMNKMPSLD